MNEPTTDEILLSFAEFFDRRGRRGKMSEPTIDDMRKWLLDAEWALDETCNISPRANAIRAILEQHRDWVHEVRGAAASIRAFVERVRIRRQTYGEFIGSEEYWHDAIRDEIAAMEQESK